MEETKPMEDQNSSNTPAPMHKRGFLNSRWAMILATAIIALIIGFFIGHCCHCWRHCCGDRCEMRGHGMMMHRGWERGSGFGSRWDGMRDGEMHGGGMRGMGPMGMHEGFDPKAMVDHMKQELGLSDQQVQQITALLEQQKSKMESAMKSDSGRSQDWQAGREQLHAQIKAILTPEQQTKFQQMMAEHMGRGE